MSSSRLPGKVMMPILGEPMIVRQIERLRRCTSLDGIAVATSVDPSDDVIAAVAAEVGCEVVRGPLDDVLSRYEQAIQVLQPYAVVRLTADCPLASPTVIDQVVSKFWSSCVDYCSNTLRPTFPDGLDVEVVRANVLLEVASETSDPHEREHVTLGVYRRTDRYRMVNVEGEMDLSGLRWTVDTPDDFTFVSRVNEALYPGNTEFDLSEILALADCDPTFTRTAQDGLRNAALIGLDTGAMHG